MAIFYHTHNLLEYASGLVLIFVMLQELSSTLVLHDQVDTVHSFHHLKQFDVRMVQCLQYRYFGCNDGVVLSLLLHFNCHPGPRDAVEGKFHTAKAAFAYGSEDPILSLQDIIRGSGSERVLGCQPLTPSMTQL
jgi:hypothetical protein